jgi:hypothetical protein
VDLRALDPAEIADEFVESEIAVNAASVDIDERCAAALNIALNACVAGDECSPGKQRYVASNLGS